MLLGLKLGVDVGHDKAAYKSPSVVIHRCTAVFAGSMPKHEAAMYRSWVQMWASTTRSRTLLRS